MSGTLSKIDSVNTGVFSIESQGMNNSPPNSHPATAPHYTRPLQTEKPPTQSERPA